MVRTQQCAVWRNNCAPGHDYSENAGLRGNCRNLSSVSTLAHPLLYPLRIGRESSRGKPLIRGVAQ